MGAAMPTRINIHTAVNSAHIRREVHNGRDHWVVPSYTLPANVVMNGGLYPASEIDAHYSKLEGTLAPIGHPTINGKPVSAFLPEAINAHHAGAWNRNVRKSGNRIALEKWIDIETARQHPAGAQLLDRLEALERGEDVEPIHTSAALFLIREPAPAGASGYSWIARISDIDHDAILLDEPGAATPEQGVGMMINTADATLLAGNEDAAMEGESYRAREARLDQAAKKHFVQDGNAEYVWVADFTDTQMVVVIDGGDAKVYSYDYRVEDGQVVISGDGREVRRSESWVTVATNAMKRLFSFQARPDHHDKGGDMPLTDQEKAELTKDISESVVASLNSALAPLAEKIDKLETNHTALQEQITANQRAEEKAKRDAVTAVYGEVVANSLTGAALDGLYARLDGVAPLPAINGQAAPAKIGAPDPAEYLPE